jgi:hypothetical protein
MLNLPWTIMDAMNPFAPCFFGATTWGKAKTLCAGAILTPGRRTVSEALRVMGLGESQQYAQYYQQKWLVQICSVFSLCPLRSPCWFLPLSLCVSDHDIKQICTSSL